MSSADPEVPWGKLAAILGAAASAVAVLAWFGIPNYSALTSKAASGSATTAPASSPSQGGYFFSPGGDTPTAVAASTFSPLPPAPTSAVPATSPSPQFDPGELGQASTDPAPFTTAALMPHSFTDGKNVEFTLQSGGTQYCVQNDMSSTVQSVLRQYGCTQVLTAAYTASSGAVTANNDVLVSVQIFAFSDTATAQQVHAQFPSGEDWDFGFYCAASGYGANPCSPNAGTANATKSEYLSQNYRYLMQATALYTNAAHDDSVLPWLASAAQEAVDVAGPAYYISNQQ